MREGGKKKLLIAQPCFNQPLRPSAPLAPLAFPQRESFCGERGRGEPSGLCGVDLAHIFESTLSFPSFSSNTNRIQLQHNDKTSQPNGPTQKSCKWCGAPPASLQCCRRHYTVIYSEKVHAENSQFNASKMNQFVTFFNKKIQKLHMFIS